VAETDDPVETFLAADTAERLRIARDGRHEDELRRQFGDAAWQEYLGLAGRAVRHLAPDAPGNLLFIPGVMGSLLRSEGLGGVWWIDLRALGHLNDLRLSPDGAADADRGHRVGPFSTDPTYEPFLAAVLQQDDFGHELFPYDWRKSLTRSSALLARRIAEMHEENRGEPVHLVAHSMGGLLVRTALMEHGAELWPKLGRIVFVGTPHYGSMAIGGYLKNHLWGWDQMALLGLKLSRETFRTLWGVLGLLPAPEGVYPGTRPGEPGHGDLDDPGHPCASFDLYRASDWELGLDPRQLSDLQDVLDGAADLHRRLHRAHQDLPPQKRQRMFMIAGVGFKSLFRLAYRDGFLWDSMEKVTSRVPGDPHRDGDGRVPLASARLDGVETRYVRGVHGGLTNIPDVYEEVFRWLREESLELPDTPEGALSRHLAPGVGESEAPHLDGTERTVSDDPGYLDPASPAPERLADLEARLAEDRLPELARIRLL
jgi:pimeloyl-ACP methyl ester carboxylesterase